jgi:alginate O-acetyltransferase complex protein AlgI
VYIPLGGNRKGLPRQILNLLIVWALTGLWHGASWNFVLWGLYYAVLLILEKTFLLKKLQKAPAVLSHLYTMVLFTLGWALFYFEDLSALGGFFRQLFSLTPTNNTGITLIAAYLPMMAVAAVASTPVLQRLRKTETAGTPAFLGQILILAVLLLLCVAALASQSYNPFIYFRF